MCQAVLRETFLSSRGDSKEVTRVNHDGTHFSRFFYMECYVNVGGQTGGDAWHCFLILSLQAIYGQNFIGFQEAK